MPSVSLVIPAFNEVAGLPATVRTARSALARHGWDHEVIVVDDGSTDGTGAVLGSLRETLGINVLTHERNLGLGAALTTGFSAATGDFVGWLPADDDFPEPSIVALLDHLGRADWVMHNTINPEVRPRVRQWLSSAYTRILNRAFHLDLRYYNGAFFARRSLIAPLLPLPTDFFAMASTAIRLARSGATHIEVSVALRNRPLPKSSAISRRNITGVVRGATRLYVELQGNVLSSRIRRSAESHTPKSEAGEPGASQVRFDIEPLYVDAVVRAKRHLPALPFAVGSPAWDGGQELLLPFGAGSVSLKLTSTGTVNQYDRSGVDEGPTRDLLDIVMARSLGAPLQELAEHGALALELAMREGKPPRVPGIMRPAHAGVAFAELDAWLKTAFAQSGIVPVRNTYEPKPGEAWLAMAMPERIEASQRCVSEWCQEHAVGVTPHVVSTEAPAQLHVQFDAEVPEAEKRRVLAGLERHLKLSLEPAIEVYLPTAQDRFQRDEQSELTKRSLPVLKPSQPMMN